MILPDIDIVKAKLAHNRDVYIRQSLVKKYDITEYEWADIAAADVDLMKANSKQADMAAAIQVEVLPFYDQRHGADGLKIVDNLIVLVELKSTWISPETIWQTENGTLYTGVPGKTSKTTVDSAALGSWSKLSPNSVANKNLLTFLVWFESKPGNKFFMPIGAWSLPGEYVFGKLSRAVQQGNTSAQIKSSEFRLNGTHEHCLGIAKGLCCWKDEMRLIVPTHLTERAQKKLNRPSTSLPKKRSKKNSKIDPSLQKPNPCTEDLDQP